MVREAGQGMEGGGSQRRACRRGPLFASGSRCLRQRLARRVESRLNYPEKDVSVRGGGAGSVFWHRVLNLEEADMVGMAREAATRLS